MKGKSIKDILYGVAIIAGIAVIGIGAVNGLIERHNKEEQYRQEIEVQRAQEEQERKEFLAEIEAKKEAEKVAKEKAKEEKEKAKEERAKQKTVLATVEGSFELYVDGNGEFYVKNIGDKKIDDFRAIFDINYYGSVCYGKYLEVECSIEVGETRHMIPYGFDKLDEDDVLAITQAYYWNESIKNYDRITNEW